MKSNTRKLVAAAAVGAVYAALTMCLAPISYGTVQFRVSEVMCVLPFFLPWTSWGLFLGCALSNVISSAGILDVVFGSLATLASCLCIAALGRCEAPGLGRKILACLMPVMFNGVIIGAVLAWVSVPKDGFWAAMALFGAQVAGGEAAVLFILGLPALCWLPKQAFFRKILASYK